MKIMIVDDHSAMRRTLRSIIDSFSDQKIEYMECEEGAEAVKQYSAFQPDIVLMDIQLKGINGFIAAEEILEKNATAKIIFVTSYDTPVFWNKAKEIHALGFISKEHLSELNLILQSFTT